LTCYSELKEKLKLFDNDFEYEDKALLLLPSSRAVTVACESALNETELLDENTVDAFLKKVKKLSGQKGKELFAPLRMIFTGKLHGPDLKEVMIVLGKRECLRRVQIVANMEEEKRAEG
jgi:nondiscriminating glutamyl-tRNA synthetase